MAGGLVPLRVRGGGRSYKRMAEINVTPMVDVMLVLLIVFMVTAPLLTVGVKVDLPKTQAGALGQNDDKPLEITLDAKGQIYLQDTPVALDQLVPKLTAISQANHEARIYIRGDRSLDYGTMMQVLGAITSAGYSKVALLSNLANAPPDRKR
jgi:biopolymer transport protein TolR